MAEILLIKQQLARAPWGLQEVCEGEEGIQDDCAGTAIPKILEVKDGS
jgi:hypothetical protein